MCMIYWDCGRLCILCVCTSIDTMCKTGSSTIGRTLQDECMVYVFRRVVLTPDIAAMLLCPPLSWSMVGDGIIARPPVPPDSFALVDMFLGAGAC